MSSTGTLEDQLTLTPSQTAGPFYPDKLPLDTDNDLVIINDSVTPALGTVTHLSGRILDRSGAPIRNAIVEIWQPDDNGAYIHPGTANLDRRDPNFQGFGRFVTGPAGGYYFRTIKPVPYPGREAPHIHFAVKVKGHDAFITQCYINGHPGNAIDRILNKIGDAKARASVMADFNLIPGSFELEAKFDIVLGFMAEV